MFLIICELCVSFRSPTRLWSPAPLVSKPVSPRPTSLSDHFLCEATLCYSSHVNKVLSANVCYCKWTHLCLSIPFKAENLCLNHLLNIYILGWSAQGGVVYLGLNLTLVLSKVISAEPSIQWPPEPTWSLSNAVNGPHWWSPLHPYNHTWSCAGRCANTNVNSRQKQISIRLTGPLQGITAAL